MKACIYIVSTLILVVALGYYVAHIWTDCLQDHSFLTCMRMLGDKIQGTLILRKGYIVQYETQCTINETLWASLPYLYNIFPL
jgi:hypothetical protein